MTTIKQALAELENNGVVVYHHGTPISSAYLLINGKQYSYNKFRDESMSAGLKHAIKHECGNLKQPSNNNNKGMSNGTILQQEFTIDGFHQ